MNRARRWLLMAVLACVPGAAAAVPDWLGGTPDTTEYAARCAVYDAFLERADAQTGGLASRRDLARSRVVNIVNKLVEHHRAGREAVYRARVRYLVLADDGPMHFRFRIAAERLDRLLAASCAEAS